MSPPRECPTKDTDWSSGCAATASDTSRASRSPQRSTPSKVPVLRLLELTSKRTPPQHLPRQTFGALPRRAASRAAGRTARAPSRAGEALPQSRRRPAPSPQAPPLEQQQHPLHWPIRAAPGSPPIPPPPPTRGTQGRPPPPRSTARAARGPCAAPAATDRRRGCAAPARGGPPAPHPCPPRLCVAPPKIWLLQCARGGREGTPAG